ncbi:hypothetical protein RMSM_04416 [Rhodopirellula maiorica SM1]|uniref:Uncharacterized protein n=1 Tax=Rhodopirellula maiorica SM1 TaxID=1265738 RepID=M5RH16_9BACT|nr:hypothetical protein RMSM_04416 [Rhodopirellula maiorica SM1]
MFFEVHPMEPSEIVTIAPSKNEQLIQKAIDASLRSRCAKDALC